MQILEKEWTSKKNFRQCDRKKENIFMQFRCNIKINSKAAKKECERDPFLTEIIRFVLALHTRPFIKTPRCTRMPSALTADGPASSDFRFSVSKVSMSEACLVTVQSTRVHPQCWSFSSLLVLPRFQIIVFRITISDLLSLLFNLLSKISDLPQKLTIFQLCSLQFWPQSNQRPTHWRIQDVPVPMFKCAQQTQISVGQSDHVQSS